jgi:hypothetical protein
MYNSLPGKIKKLCTKNFPVLWLGDKPVLKEGRMSPIALHLMNLMQ